MNPEKFSQTREDLLERFAGLSVSPATIQGTWLHQGVRYEDQLVSFVVDVADTIENHDFFVDFKQTLLERFEQLEIHLVCYFIEIL